MAKAALPGATATAAESGAPSPNPRHGTPFASPHPRTDPELVHRGVREAR